MRDVLLAKDKGGQHHVSTGCKSIPRASEQHKKRTKNTQKKIDSASYGLDGERVLRPMP